MGNSSDMWHNVCDIDDLVENSGVCALVEGKQIAIFHLSSEPEQLYAVSNYDPVGKANVISRGIVGSIDDEPIVASPLYKQHFSLIDGRCFEESAALTVYPARIEGRQVQLQLTA